MDSFKDAVPCLDITTVQALGITLVGCRAGSMDIALLAAPAEAHNMVIERKPWIKRILVRLGVKNQGSILMTKEPAQKREHYGFR